MTSRKKDQADGAFDDYTSWEKFKKSPEVRGARFVVRVCFTVIVYLYLASAAIQTTRWMQVKWVRIDDISKIDFILEKAIKNDDFTDALNWVKSRPLEDTEIIVKTIEKNASDLPSLFFFEQAARVRNMSDNEGFAFWSIYARYRLQYDLIRCAAPDLLDSLTFMSQSGAASDNLRTIFKSKEKAAAIMKKVVSFDAEKPASNSPQMLCTMARQVSNKELELPPPYVWRSIRHRLITLASEGITKMEEQPSVPVPPPEITTPATP